MHDHYNRMQEHYFSIRAEKSRDRSHNAMPSTQVGQLQTQNQRIFVVDSESSNMRRSSHFQNVLHQKTQPN